MVVRLADSFKSDIPSLNKIFIGTIHGWCNKFLEENANLSNTKVLDEFEQLQLIQRIYSPLGLNVAYDGKNMFDKIKIFVKDLEIFYNENLNINDKNIPTKVHKVLSNYISFLEAQRLIDFGSLIRKCISFLQTNKSDKEYHIFIDEYQDVNNAQVILVQELLNKNSNSTVFAVGDPRQAIYQWRGGNIGRLLQFKKDFKDYAIENMTMNRRSRNGIVEFANIIAKNMSFDADINIEDMTVYKDKEDLNNSVIIDIGNEKHDEAVVETIVDLHNNGVPYSDIAILLRSVIWDGRDLMHLLDSEKIPYYSPNKNTGMEFIEKFVLSIIRVMELLEEVPHNQEEEKEINAELTLRIEHIKSYCSADKLEIHKAISGWHKLLTTPKRKLNYHVFFENEQYNFRRQLFDFCDRTGFLIPPEDLSLQEGFAAVTQIMRAIEEVYRRRFSMSNNLREKPFEVFCRNLRWTLKFQIERWTETGMKGTSGDRVTISTVHATKGLEYPVVLMPHILSGKFPRKSSTYKNTISDAYAKSYGTGIEDERRLWYVAVTRAIDRLYLFAAPDSKASPFIHLDDIVGSKVICIIRHIDELKKQKLSKIEVHKKEYYFNIGVTNFLLILECPYHFYLRYIAGVNVPVGKQFGAGNILHKVIERLEREGTENKKKIIDEEVYLPLGEYYDEAAAKKGIIERIDGLLNSKILENIQFSEFPFTIKIGNLIIGGVIDATRKTKKGIEIIDWKSTIHDVFLKRYENQIKIYAYALMSMNTYVERGLIYTLSEKDIERNKYIVKVDQKNIEKDLNDAKAKLEEISKGRIIPTPSVMSCNACDVKEICPLRKK